MADNINSDAIISDWFKIGKAVAKIQAPSLRRRCLYNNDDASIETSSVASSSLSNYRDSNLSTSYAQAYVEEEEKLALRDDSDDDTSSLISSRSNILSQIEQLTVTSGNHSQFRDPRDDSTNVYKHFDFRSRCGENLPIYKYKKQIVSMIDTCPVTVIEGDTGSGKTTQVPMYILEQYKNENRDCRIIVTQPRRIAAISIAKRVSEERGWKLGSIVGYQVGLDSVVSSDTKVTYVTTGVLLEKILHAKTLNDYTHIILDEIHERDKVSDFVLLVVRKLARTVSKQVKIVLMSATIDASLFTDYFTVPVGNKMVKANKIRVEGKSFKVFEFYKDCYSSQTLYDTDPMEPHFLDEAVKQTHEYICSFDKLEIWEQRQKNGEFAPSRGSVLVFLPGIDEINKVDAALERAKNDKKWEILPLHSSITLEEQSKVFQAVAPGYRKIILSTNIAESSITMIDITFVIDFCLTKNLISDPDTNYTSLKLEWASKSQCKQRKGRAGRVANGRVYRLVSEEFYNSLMEYGIPEMKRSPLHDTVLKSKLLDMGEPKAILGLALDPPYPYDIERTILTLMEVGALAAVYNDDGGIRYPMDGKLTWVGKVIGSLPIDPHLGKLILLGYAFGCLDEAIIIAAGLSLKSVFSRPFQKPLDSYKSKLLWAHDSYSDCIAICNVYKVWKAHRQSNFFRRPGAGKNGEKEWGKRNFVEIRRLVEVELLVQELKKRLNTFGIRCPKPGADGWQKAQKHLLLKFVIAGAFYPNFFVKGFLDENEIVREVGGFDPFSTVVVSGLPPDHQGILYVHALEKMFSDIATNVPRLHFENSRVYVNFETTRQELSKKNHNKESIGGSSLSKIPLEMYYAVKMGQGKSRLELTLLPKIEAQRQMARLNESIQPNSSVLRSERLTTFSSKEIKKIPMPRVSLTDVPLNVTAFTDFGNFWAQYDTPEYTDKLMRLRKFIKDDIAKQDQVKPSNFDIKEKEIYLSPYSDDTREYYRVRIEKKLVDTVWVYFIDYGNMEEKSKNVIREITEQEILRIPSLIMKCAMANIKPKPSVKTCPDGNWTDKLKNDVAKLLEGESIVARIFSVVHDTLRIEVILKDKRGFDYSLKDKLISEGSAEHQEEDSLSKQNHELRMKLKSCSSEERTVDCSLLLSSNDLQEKTMGGRTIKLHGPYSPLLMSFAGITKVSSCRSVKIEMDSVNSVALDDQPNDESLRLLVATDANLNTTGTTVIARSTTLFPNIRGLVALLSILFAPQAELRTDPDRRRYIGALCGLGFESQTKRPLFSDHDVEVQFDFPFTQDDLALINSIRYGINFIWDCNHPDGEKLWKIQKEIQKRILDLICQSREFIKPLMSKKPYKWDLINKEFLMESDIGHTASESHVEVLPLLKGIRLPKDDILTSYIHEHLEELQSKAVASNRRCQDANQEDVHCRLCNETMASLSELKDHLKSARHLDLVYDLKRNKC